MFCPYTYTVEAAADYDNPIEEEMISFSQLRGATGAASALCQHYAGVADEEDYTSIDKLAVNFAAQQTTKTVKVQQKLILKRKSMNL